MFISLFFFLTVLCCSNGTDNNALNEQEPQKVHSNVFTVRIDKNSTYQVIDHFGASDAWSCQFVGKWPSPKKEAIADLLFSREMNENGDPKGIGLSLWRFNVGAGSAEQGSASDIADEWRRAESFLQEDGSYDWGRQAGQVWFAKAAQVRGVDKLLLFSNSPPVCLTKNGKANTDNGEVNLDASDFADFGDFLADVTVGLQDRFGLTVNYISPINEPQWDWKNGQEGCPYFNGDIAKVVRALNNSLVTKNLTATIDLPEAVQISFLYENGNRGDRGNQITEFFNPGSTNYIGDLSNIGGAISGHGYFTTFPFDKFVKTRRQLYSSMTSMSSNFKYWMSEYTLLEDNAQINGNGRDLAMDPALYMAKVIHTDLDIAQASAWHWWLGVSPYDYKDGLVYVDLNKQDGNYYESKLLWALGNYSRFVRPGYKRIKLESIINGEFGSGSDNENFLFTGYKDPNSPKIVLVLINSNPEAMDIQLQNQNSIVHNMEAYVTSKSSNLKKTDLEDKGLVSIPGRSVVTIVIEN